MGRILGSPSKLPRPQGAWPGTVPSSHTWLTPTLWVYSDLDHPCPSSLLPGPDCFSGNNEVGGISVMSPLYPQPILILVPNIAWNHPIHFSSYTWT